VTPDRAAHDGDAAALVSSGASVVEADIRDADAMRRLVRAQNVLFHLSARSGSVRSVEDPLTDLDVNGRGSLVVLEALRAENRDAHLVFAGSRLEYGRANAGPVAENQPSDPLCAHAIHKLLVEQYLRVYGRLFGLKSIVARITNPFGPGQPAARTDYGIVNRMIHLAIEGGTLTVYGDGRQRRDYIYIDDVMEALMGLGERATADVPVYNVGTGVGTPLIDMARSITSIAGSGRIACVAWPPLAEQVETGDFVADISRIKRDVGWSPSVSLREGLERTVSFYRAQTSA
jgi:nucleoside-diphosphate-sugar epimerase